MTQTWDADLNRRLKARRSDKQCLELVNKFRKKHRSETFVPIRFLQSIEYLFQPVSLSPPPFLCHKLLAIVNRASWCACCCGFNLCLLEANLSLYLSLLRAIKGGFSSEARLRSCRKQWKSTQRSLENHETPTETAHSSRSKYRVDNQASQVKTGELFSGIKGSRRE